MKDTDLINSPLPKNAPLLVRNLFRLVMSSFVSRCFEIHFCSSSFFLSPISNGFPTDLIACYFLYNFLVAPFEKSGGKKGVKESFTVTLFYINTARPQKTEKLLPVGLQTMYSSLCSATRTTSPSTTVKGLTKLLFAKNPLWI